MPAKLLNLAALPLSILLVFAAASFGALYGPGEWYAGIAKPAWNPPNWVFGPVWTFLYLSMAVAAWLVFCQRHAKPVRAALAVYALQLLLNALWTFLFFGLHRMGLALAEILLLETLIILTAILFWPISRLAALLFIPYIAWVAFASFLNFTLWRLNA
jgi:tryptophan-rich sensory protein